MAGISGAYENFKQAIKNKAPDTVITYDDALKYYRDSQGFSDFDDLTADTPHDIQERIKNLINSLSYAKANKIISALRLFYAANQVMINWDHVVLFKPAPPEKDMDLDRPYTKAEITTMLEAADVREKCAILLMATGGVRIGGALELKIEHLHYVVDKQLYALNVYARSPTAFYTTFITPEASLVLKKYLGKRTSGPLFVNKRESDLAVNRMTLSAGIWKLAVKAGLRTPGDRLERQNVQLHHGFRKFFRTALNYSGIEHDQAERLVGHTRLMVRLYDKPTPEELLKRTRYELAIPALTFNAL